MKVTEAEWSVLEALWRGERFSLKEVTDALQGVNGWSKNTVHTYLTRMEQKGLVSIDKSLRKPYAAAVTREQCARQERDELLTKVYGGRTGDLIAAFLKETKIPQTEVERLRKLLDDMEV